VSFRINPQLTARTCFDMAEEEDEERGLIKVMKASACPRFSVCPLPGCPILDASAEVLNDNKAPPGYGLFILKSLASGMVQCDAADAACRRSAQARVTPVTRPTHVMPASCTLCGPYCRRLATTAGMGFGGRALRDRTVDGQGMKGLCPGSFTWGSSRLQVGS